MESTIDAMSKAYDELVASVTGVVEAKEASGGRQTPATARAVENFGEQWLLFKEACDRAEVAVETATRRIATEHVVDAASVSMQPAKTVLVGLSPVSVPQLDRAMDAINSLAADATPRESRGGAGSSPDGGTPPAADKAGAGSSLEDEAECGTPSAAEDAT